MAKNKAHHNAKLTVVAAGMGCAAVLTGVRMSEGRNRVEFRDQADIRPRLSGI